MRKLQTLILAATLISCGPFVKAQTKDVKTTNWHCSVRVYELSNAEVFKLDLNLIPVAKSNGFEASRANVDNKTLQWLESNAGFVTASESTLTSAHHASAEWNISNVMPDVCRQKLTLVRKPEASGFLQLLLSTSNQPNQRSSQVDACSFSTGLPLAEQSVAFRTDCGHESSSLVVIKLHTTESADQSVDSTVVTASGLETRIPRVPLGSFK